MITILCKSVSIFYINLFFYTSLLSKGIALSFLVLSLDPPALAVVLTLAPELAPELAPANSHCQMGRRTICSTPYIPTLIPSKKRHFFFKKGVICFLVGAI